MFADTYCTVIFSGNIILVEWAMKMNSPTDIGKLALDEEGINQKIKEKVVIRREKI